MALFRLLFVAMFLLHGLIHILGFVKAMHIWEVPQLTIHISRFAGLGWLFAAILFIVSFILYVSGGEWWVWCTCAVLISQVLVVTAWTDARWATIPNILILGVAITDYATYHYEQRFKTDVAFALRARETTAPRILIEADINHLPLAIQRYLHYAGCIGRPVVNNFKVAFEGNIRKNNSSAWMPFRSEQYNTMANPSRFFFMKARMMGLPVSGYHCYKDGKAFMDIRLLSLINVQYQQGSVMDTAETVTFFNDMCCMAPATLIDSRIQWLESDSNHVKASFTNNAITVTAVLYFDKDGTLINFVSGDRYAAGDNGVMERIPWSTPLKEYIYLNGHHIASYAETIYHYPNGDLVYGNFRLKDVQYNIR